MKKITIRNVVEELFKQPNLIVKYVETEDGGFDLSVRIDDVGYRDEPEEE